MDSEGKPLPLSLYILVVAVIFITVYIPYFVDLGTVASYLVVYGIPVAVVSVIFGKQILSRAAKNNKKAFPIALGSFSSFYLVGIFLSVIALTIILVLNPSAEQLLQKINPALDVPPNVAWIMIAVALLVVGPAEEYIFRGFLYGGMLSLSKGRNWAPLAVVSAVIFAAAHGYYALTYGIASPVYFIQLTTFGIAMAVAYHWSGGNLLAPIVIHGVHDAIGFLGIATTKSVGLAAEGIFVGVGMAIAVYYVLFKMIHKKPMPLSDASPPSFPPPA